MKQLFNLSFLFIAFSILVFSCDEDLNQLDPTIENLTLEDIVNKAQIIKGNVPFAENELLSVTIDPGSYLFIPTPDKKGYLQIEKKSKEEIDEILKLVSKRFEREFQGFLEKKQNSNGRINSKECTDWEPVFAGPNSNASRYCVVSIFGIIIDHFWEYCVCGYCCD